MEGGLEVGGGEDEGGGDVEFHALDVGGEDLGLGAGAAQGDGEEKVPEGFEEQEEVGEEGVEGADEGAEEGRFGGILVLGVEGFQGLGAGGGRGVGD